MSSLIPLLRPPIPPAFSNPILPSRESRAQLFFFPRGSAGSRSRFGVAWPGRGTCRPTPALLHRAVLSYELYSLQIVEIYWLVASPPIPESSWSACLRVCVSACRFGDQLPSPAWWCSVLGWYQARLPSLDCGGFAASRLGGFCAGSNFVFLFISGDVRKRRSRD